MKLPPLILTLTPFLPLVLSTPRLTTPQGCLTVSKSPSSSQYVYPTLQSAITSLSLTSPTPQCIFLTPGTYTEQVLIPPRSAPLSIYGSTPDTSSYTSNSVTLVSSLSQASSSGLSNDQTATLRVKSSNFKLYNINVENRYGKGSQAVALSAYADSGYYGCAFRGYQDTVLAQEGKQVYSKCEIVGVTDFIFGQHASAWFERVDIRVLSSSVGYVTASGRDSSSDPNYYVFNSCTIAAANGNSVANGAFYLGRPWREYARVVFQRTSMSSVINSAGWRIWNSGDERTSNVYFGEFGNTGAGASGARASFSKKLGSAVGISTILGAGYASAGFYDSSYM